LRVHPRAVEKDAEFRAGSEAARGALSGDMAASLARHEASFLAACQARPPSGPSGEARGARPSAYPNSHEVAAMRETHAKAYAPWTEAEESDLRRRHHQGETVAAIADRLGRKPGAIRSRLKKLALI
jgi:DNA-directed RNA polymerase specialized sigma24 family protein